MEANEVMIREMKTKLGATVQLVYRSDGYAYFKYIPGHFGTDTFTYVIRQGNKEDRTTVNVFVDPKKPTGIDFMTIEKDFSILKY